ncbi:MAG: Gfo/Idh/MocA family oxidoreductase, partial [bacterium]
MKRMGRRAFLKGAVAGGAALAVSPHAKALGANDEVGVAVVGFRSQGRNHIKWLRGLPGVRVVALCDPDQAFLDREMTKARKLNEKPAGYTDVRKLLDDKNVDALSTATPDHWHALATVWACQAGKDVYVEKPLCHDLWEGRQTVEAAKRHNRIVQFGNQNHGHRTGPPVLDDPKRGKIRVAYASLNRGRRSIGKVDGPQKPPASLDYDLWTGPAPLEPLMRRRLHYDWHWVWP